MIGDRLTRLRAPAVRNAALFDGAFEIAPSIPDAAPIQPAAGAEGSPAGFVEGRRFWVQSFGGHVDQNARDGGDGYEAGAFGFAAGFDSDRLIEDAILGAAIAHGRTRIDADNANATLTDIDSYQVTLYGDWDLGAGWRFGSSLAYAFGDNESERFNVGGVGRLTARGDFGSRQGSIAADLTYAFDAGFATLAPTIGALGVYSEAEDFSETGAGGAGLDVDSDGIGALEIGVGLGLEREIAILDLGSVAVDVDLGYRYELLGEELQTTSRFLGGGQAFDTRSADPAREVFTAGLGLG